MNMNTASYYDYYLVSNFGAVFSLLTNQFVPVRDNNGYWELSLPHPEKGTKRIKVHQIVAECFLPKIEGKNIVLHIDGNSKNNHYKNLEWASHFDSNYHARVLGFNNVSESNKRRWEIAKKKHEVKVSAGPKPQYGLDSSNCKYLFSYKGKYYTIRELRDIFGCTDNAAFRIARLVRANRPNPWSAAGVEFVREN